MKRLILADVKLSNDEKAAVLMALNLYADGGAPAPGSENLQFFTADYTLLCCCKARLALLDQLGGGDAKMDDWLESAVGKLSDAGAEIEGGFSLARRGFTTVINPQCLVVEAATDPKWQADYRRYMLRKRNPEINTLPNYSGDQDLCSIQVAHERSGFVLVEIVSTINGFRLHTVHAGGHFFGPLFASFKEALDYGVNVWHHTSPADRELILRMSRRPLR